MGGIHDLGCPVLRDGPAQKKWAGGALEAEILWHRDKVEVIEPKILREEVISLLRQMLERYK